MSARRWLRRAPLLALATGLMFCMTRRAVTQPKLRLQVVDAAGRPVAMADVALHWWSYPYGRLRRTTHFTTDARGLLALDEQLERETVLPFCMHGVPEHHHTVCAGAKGRGWLSYQLPSGYVDLTIRLTGGAYSGECQDFERTGRGSDPPNSRQP